MKKLLFFLSFILIIVTVGFAAGERSITWIFDASSRDDSVSRFAVPLFEKETGIKVIRESTPFSGFHEKLALDLTEKSGRFDVITISDQWFPEFIHNDWLAPMDSFMSDPKVVSRDFNAKDYLGICLAEPDFTKVFNKKYYGLPYFPGAVVLFYRTDIFQKAGLKPPKTLDELRQTAAKLNSPENNQYGIAMSYGTRGNQLHCNFITFIRCFGGECFDDSWNPTFNDSPGVKAAQYMKDLLKYNPPSAVTDDYSEALSQFANGNAAMLILWSHAIVGIENAAESKVAGKVSSVPIPAGTAKGALGADNYFAINNYSNNKADAFRFIQYITSPAIQKILWNQAKVPPTRKSVANDPIVSKSCYTGPVLATLSTYERGFPRTTSEDFFEQRMISALSGIVSTDTNIKGALDGVAEEMRQELVKTGYLKQ